MWKDKQSLPLASDVDVEQPNEIDVNNDPHGMVCMLLY